jgi:polyhydroxyalkanoate synthesis regulator phasin
MGKQDGVLTEEDRDELLDRIEELEERVFNLERRG